MLTREFVLAGPANRMALELALDPAANGFRSNGAYDPGDGAGAASGLIERYQRLIDAYPIRSIEDGLAEDDPDGWRTLTAAIGDQVQIVGDDLVGLDQRRGGQPPQRGRRRRHEIRGALAGRVLACCAGAAARAGVGGGARPGGPAAVVRPPQEAPRRRGRVGLPATTHGVVGTGAAGGDRVAAVWRPGGGPV